MSETMRRKGEGVHRWCTLPTSTHNLSLEWSCLSFSASRVVVTGELFTRGAGNETCGAWSAHQHAASSATRRGKRAYQLRGMSTSVVTPPAAAACVAEGKPSQAVRPGSLMCTWLSTTPVVVVSPVRPYFYFLNLQFEAHVPGMMTKSPKSWNTAPSGGAVALPSSTLTITPFLWFVKRERERLIMR